MRRDKGRQGQGQDKSICLLLQLGAALTTPRDDDKSFR